MTLNAKSQAHVTQTTRYPSTRRLLRDLAPVGPAVHGGTLTYTNSFTCLPDSVAASRPDVRTGTWILDASF